MKLNKKSYISTKKIFINGVIYSIDKNDRVYEAMAIENGNIVALGNNEQISDLYTDETEVIDLKFKIVLPGFINVHCSMLESMWLRKDQLSLSDAGNIQEYLKLTQSYIDSHPEEEIIYGIGWRSSGFEEQEEITQKYNPVFKGPSKKWLERIKTNKPIVLKSFDGRALWLNEKALSYFKITKDTQVPLGGKIELDTDGELLGTLKENAMNLVNIEKLISIQSYRKNSYLSNFVKCKNILHSNGITTVVIINEEQVETLFEIYKKLQIQKKLKLRIIYGVTIKPKLICKKTIYEQLHELKRNRIIYKTDLFDISIAKFYSDGIIENMTAYLFKPYKTIIDNCFDYNGMFLWEEKEFKEGIKMSNRLDFNVYIHAAGDLACKLSIDGIEYSSKSNVNYGYRNSLINMDLITKFYIRRMKMLNINAIIEPFWFYKDMNADRNQVLVIGEERAHRQYPLKSIIDEGIVTAGGSNYEMLEKTPLKAIECATIRNLYETIPSGYPAKIDMNDIRYRLNPSEKISVMEAIKMFTINAAYIIGKENEIGSLELGKKADFIVLDKDIFKISLIDIPNINIERTYFNGELVYLSE